jgi:alpha-methylacyl-CoA racemase
MSGSERRGGPLHGVRVVELAGIGPGPFCAMVLADLGAEVVRVDRPADVDGPPAAGADALNRSRPSIAVDLKHPRGAGIVLDLVERADALIEGLRPGVAERLGVGPEPCLVRNPALVYGRMTGWGQDGPYARMPGHDITYIALSGALSAIGTPQRPTVPLNLLGDFGGGGMLLAVGVLAGVLQARSTGIGQVVDAAMTDGSALLMTLIHGLRGAGTWTLEREANLLDGGVPFYAVYEAADGHIAVGGLEPQFHAAMLERMGLDDVDPAAQFDPAAWPALRERLAAEFRTRTRAQWEQLFLGTEVCVAPVLDMAEAAAHPHNAARGTFSEVGGVMQPSPAPRFSATPAAPATPPPRPGEHTTEVLARWGVDDATVAALLADGAIRQATGSDARRSASSGA